MDPLTRLQAGIEQARPVIAAATPDDYDLPTPCSEWNTREVINHMIGALTMFRDVAVDGSADTSLFGRDLIGDDALASFDSVAQEMLAAWGQPGKLDGMAKLPFAEMPAQFAIQFPAMDMVVHAWDVATATGKPVSWNAELVADTLAFCEATFANPELRGHDFAAAVPAPESADDLTKLVSFLGRTP